MKKNQHYIPQFYLKNFSVNNNRNQIGLYNLHNKIYRLDATIKNQASAKYFYGKDLDIENYFQKIEHNASLIIRNIINKEILPEKNSDNHFDLFHFLFLLDVRNPVRIKSLIEGKSKMLERVCKIDSKFDIEQYKEFDDTRFNVQMGLSIAIEMILFNSDLELKVFKNVTNKPLITSDYPVIRYNQFYEKRKVNLDSSNSYGNIGIQLLLPLSPNYCLVIYDSNIYKIGNKKSRFVNISNPKSIKNINKLQVTNCEKQIYFDDNILKHEIINLFDETKNFVKPNITHIKPYKVLDENGVEKENDEIISIYETDLKINFKIDEIKFNSKSQYLKLKNSVDQTREYVKRVKKFKENNNILNYTN